MNAVVPTAKEWTARPHGARPTYETDAVRDTVIRRFLAGETMLAIARDLGIKHNTVQAIVRTAQLAGCDLPTAWGRPDFTQSEIDTVLDRWLAGDLQREIGKALELTPQQVSYIVVKARRGGDARAVRRGVRPQFERPAYRRNRAEAAALRAIVIAGHRLGLSNREIADSGDIKLRYVQAIVKRHKESLK